MVVCRPVRIIFRNSSFCIVCLSEPTTYVGFSSKEDVKCAVKCAKNLTPNIYNT